jgi:phosphatidylinositol kinase/protein kinase (PI-3  family)
LSLILHRSFPVLLFHFLFFVHAGFLEVRARAGELISMLSVHLDSEMPCFLGPTGAQAIPLLRERFALHLNEEQALLHAEQLVENSINNSRSNMYDTFQRLVSGIY